MSARSGKTKVRSITGGLSGGVIMLLQALAGGAAQEPSPAPSADNEDAAIERAVLDYVEGFYQSNAALSERSVRRDFSKRGFRWNPAAGSYGEQEFMSFDRLYEVVAAFKTIDVPESAARRITILDRLDQTATAKLEAMWGVDYIHLAKYEGKWMIVNVLWQSHPKAAANSAETERIGPSH